MNQNLYSLSSERAVLGAVLVEPESYEKVSEIVHDDDFFRPEHRYIFEAIRSLCDASEPLDFVTLGEHLDKNGLIEQVGGIDYLIELATNVPSTANVVSYAEIVKERAIIRNLAGAADRITSRTHERDGMSSSQMIEEAERSLASLSSDKSKAGDIELIGSILNDTIDDIDERYHNGESITGIKTGLNDLDDLTGGLQDTDLIILAGRPAMGKTSISVNIAEYAAIHEGKTVVVFSLEMPKKQLAQRMISSIGRIDQNKLKTGKLDQPEFDKMMGAFKQMKDSKFLIDDTAGISPAYARNKLKKVEREYGAVDLVLIDYLQLMQIPNYKEGRTNEVSEISRSLKAMAKEFNCPVIALSQLNRSLEQRTNKRPINSDLRESGSIEQDADIIMFVYRDEVYNQDTPDKGIAEIIIGKQRNGPIGTCKAAFLGQYTRFENLAKGYNDY